MPARGDMRITQSPNQVGGGHGNRPSQDQQGAAAEGGNTHPAATPPSQQGWWAGAAWMLGGRLERHSSQGRPEATRNFR